MILVISSPKVAQEMFLRHDLAFSSRAVPHAGAAGNHDKFSMVWLPVSPKWRDLRKIATIQLFTTHTLDASQIIRQKKVNELIDYARQCGKNGMPIDIGKAGFTTSLNLLSNTFFSMDLARHASSYSQEFKELFESLLEMEGKPNLSDFFPLIKHLDLQGVFRRTTYLVNKMMSIFEEIIDGRLKDDNVKDDVLSTLLKNVENNELTLDDVKHLLLDLFVAGTDTTSSTLEWAMTELLSHPQAMEKAQLEVEEVVGKHGYVQESDISKLPYLQAIVKETLRLHPPAPFLIPHKAEKDVQLCNYFVPKDATIWVNVWAIGRSSTVWTDSELFYPERFLENDIDMKGRDFELIPFGSGRRICPGLPLGYRMINMMLASLLHSFNWKCVHNGTNLTGLDVEEKFGLTLQKVEPLQAKPLLK
ncbi:Geraniol 8-hydroxylase [Bienertia sinuspersici]